MVMRALALCACLLIACKERGTETIELSIPQACSSATELKVWFQLHGNCSSCAATCGCCSTSGTTCKPGCDGTCTTDDLANGLTVTPPGPGSYALVIDVIDATSHTITAETCAQVEIDADGTMSQTIPLTATCCTP